MMFQRSNCPSPLPPGCPGRLPALPQPTETLPAFAAIAAGAATAGRLGVTDPLAMWVLYARIAQSLVHIASTSVAAVQVRAVFYLAQIVIYLWWVLRPLG
jgi:hypothetical protein